MKTKIVCEQLHDQEQYRVIKLTNLTSPEIGKLLSKKEVDILIREGRGNLQVEIRQESYT